MGGIREVTPPKNAQEALSRAKEAQSKIQGTVKKTRLASSKSCSDLAGAKVFLKFENQQTTGSFKIRGALNKLHSLTDEERKKGIIASSAGNHSQGVAYSAERLGVQASIVMPETAPLSKVLATKAYGAHVIQAGEYYDEAYTKAQELADEKGLTFVHPFEDDAVIAGQATVGLEIFEQAESVDSIIAPIGGGGLISGIAMVAKAINPKCRIYGVQTASMPGMSCIFNDQKVDPLSLRSTIADGIAVKTPSQQMYDKYISRYVDEVITVQDEEIAAAMVMLLERKKAVVEGAGAASLAGAIYGNLNLGESTAVVLSGGNIDLNTISKVIQKGLTQTGRLAHISVIVDDHPGTLNKVTSVLGDHKANVLQVDHNRAAKHLALRETRIDFMIETSDDEHVESIRSALVSSGMRVI